MPQNAPTSPEMQRYQQLEQHLKEYSDEIRKFQAERQQTLDDLIPKLKQLADNIKELEKRPGTETHVKEFKSKLAIGEMRASNIRQNIQKYEQELKRETDDVRREQRELYPLLVPRAALAG